MQVFALDKPVRTEEIRRGFFVLVVLSALLTIGCIWLDQKFDDELVRYLKQQQSTKPQVLPHDQRFTTRKQTRRGVLLQEAHKMENHKEVLLRGGLHSNPKLISVETRDDHMQQAHLPQRTRILQESHKIEVLTVNKESYWNLSCPFEMSMYSAAHMGNETGSNYYERAVQAKALVDTRRIELEAINWSKLKNRRIFFIGDSLLRQTFISAACMRWQEHQVVDYALPWFEKRSVQSRQPHTMGRGKHSKFEEGRILLQGNTELIFHNGIGGLLELEEGYESHDPETWIKACFLQTPLTTVIPIYPEDPSMRDSLSTLNVKREKISLNRSDLVLINASVHPSRKFNLRNIADLVKCKNSTEYPESLWPTFQYVVTSPPHFPTKSGAFDESLRSSEGDFACTKVSTFQDHIQEEEKMLRDLIPAVGTELLPMQTSSGELHVGGRDCLHWIQPGVPDLVAASILKGLPLVHERRVS